MNRRGVKGQSISNEGRNWSGQDKDAKSGRIENEGAVGAKGIQKEGVPQKNRSFARKKNFRGKKEESPADVLVGKGRTRSGVWE